MSDDIIIVDRKGLAAKLKNKPRAFIVYELLQNAWDEDGVTFANVTTEMLAGKPVCRITVEDDCPDGFQDLASVYTMFRPSKKAPDPTKRGRFELGEKLVIAVASRMEVFTTTGTILIENETRKRLRRKRDKGSLITVDVRMNREQYAEMMEQVAMLIPPGDIPTRVNGKPLDARKPLHTFTTTLPTIVADEEDGHLKSTERKTEVRVYEPLVDEEAHVYEMGIPVVATGDKWHYDVQQRVPVNWERNNIPPRFLKSIRVEVINAMADKLDQDEAAQPWVAEAIEDERIEGDAWKTVIETKYDDDIENLVANDPSDPEGVLIGISKGMTVVHGGSFSKGAWANARKHGFVKPAGQVTPSPRPYDPEGKPEMVKPQAEWTADMKRIVAFSKEVFYYLIDQRLSVYIVTEPMAGWSANFGHGRLCLNYGSLGKRWFARKNRDPEVLKLLIHEFVHHTVSNHLSHEMADTACLLGAKLANMALEYPEVFED